MARKNINVGANQNDGTGDKLRDAMMKVNENFIELYSTGTIDNNLEFSKNAVINATALNSNITLNPNGAGIFISTKGAQFNTSHDPDAFLSVFSSDSTAEPVLNVDSTNKVVGVNRIISNAAYGLIADGIHVVPRTDASLAAALLGNVQIGGSSSHVVNLVGSLGSSIIPASDESVSLGQSSNRFSYVYGTNLESTTVTANLITANTLVVDGLQYTNLAVSGDSVFGNILMRHDKKITTVDDGASLELHVTEGGSVKITATNSTQVLQVIGSATINGSVTAEKLVGQVVTTTLPPTTANGATGDENGIIAADANNLYICVNDYSGTTPIWKSIPLLDFGSSEYPVTLPDPVVVTPGGNTSEVQYNLDGEFAGSQQWTFTENGPSNVPETMFTTLTGTNTTVMNALHVESRSTIDANDGTRQWARFNFDRSFWRDEMSGLESVIRSSDISVSAYVSNISSTMTSTGIDVVFGNVNDEMFSHSTITSNSLKIETKDFAVSGIYDWLNATPTGIEFHKENSFGDIFSVTITGPDYVPAGVNYTIKLPSNVPNNNDGILFNSDGSSYFAPVDIASYIQQNYVPSSPLGQDGDMPGKIAFNDDYIFVCTGNYDGVTNIWKRTAVTDVW